MAAKSQRLPGKCAGCPDKGPENPSPDGWEKPCSKYNASKRLCGKIDINLVSLLPQKGLSELEELSNKIAQNVLRANLDLPDPPKSADELVEWVKSAHGAIFEPIPEIAGRFRTEDVAFGGRGVHRRTGFPWRKVEGAMASLFARYKHLENTYGDGPFLAMAGLLQRIFEIHPFMDGNGRVGRLLVASIADEKGYFLMHEREFAPDAYLNALTYAHRGIARESAARDPFFTAPPEKKALAPLANYLKKVCIHVDSFFEEEEPPDWDPFETSEPTERD